MILGEYKVKKSHLFDFNSRFFDYGEDLKNYIFDFQGKDIGTYEVTYKIKFYDKNSNFKDGITKSVVIEKQNWFENFFEKI